MATQITATLPTLDFPLEADYPTQEDWAAFSAAAEENFGILGGSWSTQMQLWKTEANAMSIELNNNADIVQSVGNYQGDWVSQGYTLGQSVSVSGIYYICKLTHTTGQNPTDMGSLYWSLVIGNWNLKADKTEVALKVDKNMSAYTTKTTPVDADLIPLSDSAASFGIKKLSWVNLKATLTTYFNTLYNFYNPNPIIMTGVVSFNSITNEVAGTNIGVGVEVGDVILFSGATDSKNNSEFTIEVINNANTIIVNQAHANKGTTKNVANRASNTGVTVKLLAKWYNAPIGLGQGVVLMTSSRSTGVNYSTPPNRIIQVSVSGKNTSGNDVAVILVDGVAVVMNKISASYYVYIGSTTIVPANSVYSVSTDMNTLNSWVELR